MPALLLHMTLAKELAEQTDSSTRLVQAAQSETAALLLGSIIPDLPYHEKMAEQIVRHLFRRNYLLSEWGDLLHTRGTGQLALGMLAFLRRGKLSAAEQRPVMAMVAGYLSHYALDRVVHPLINQLVEKDGGFTMATEAFHSDMERYQNLFYHLDKLGYDIFGTSYPRQLINEMAGAGLLNPRLPLQLKLALRSALLEVHGRTPQDRQWSSWLRGVTQYGQLVSSLVGRHERLRGDLSALRAQYYQGPKLDLAQPLKRASEITLDYWRCAEAVLAAERLTNEVREGFLTRVADVDLAAGA